ncbi:hypothetical protein [Streptomyces sp. NPDC059168]
MSAARHQPDHWDLLVPIDHNPADEPTTCRRRTAVMRPVNDFAS